MSDGNKVMSYGNWKSKQPLTLSLPNHSITSLSLTFTLDLTLSRWSSLPPSPRRFLLNHAVNAVLPPYLPHGHRPPLIMISFMALYCLAYLVIIVLDLPLLTTVCGFGWWLTMKEVWFMGIWLGWCLLMGIFIAYGVCLWCLLMGTFINLGLVQLVFDWIGLTCIFIVYSLLIGSFFDIGLSLEL